MERWSSALDSALDSDDDDDDDDLPHARAPSSHYHRALDVAAAPAASAPAVRRQSSSSAATVVATPNTTASDADAGRAVPGFVQAGLGGRTKSLWRGLSRRRTDDGSGGAAEWTGGAAELQALLRDGGVRVEKQMRSAAPFRSSSFAWQARRRRAVSYTHLTLPTIPLV